MPGYRSSFCAAVICATLALAAHGANAGPLDSGECEKLRTEREALTVLGIDTYFENGAEWVQQNLTAADLNLVKRYVNVFEQLKFRCPESAVAEAEAEKKAASSGPVPPMPVRSPKRPASASKPVTAAQPG